MTLVFIYGPPGVGKLATATDLARLTGFKLFHNHASVDAVLPVFKFGEPSFYRLTHDIRLMVLEEAARRGVDVIHTYAYAHPDDLSYVEALTAAVKRHAGRMCFVQLTCDLGELERRVIASHRPGMKKIATVAQLRHVLAHTDLSTPIPAGETLRLDNTALPAPDAARQIAAHFGLSELRGSYSSLP